MENTQEKKMENVENKTNGAAERPAVPAPPVFPLKTPLPFVQSKAPALSDALAGPSKIIVVVHKDKTNPNIVTLEAELIGNWTGNWVKGAVRSIEKKYKGIKHTATRLAAEARMKESIRLEEERKQRLVALKQGVGDGR